MVKETEKWLVEELAKIALFHLEMADSTKLNQAAV